MYIFHTFESVILTPRRRESYIHFRSVKFDSNWVKCTLAFLLCEHSLYLYDFRELPITGPRIITLLQRHINLMSPTQTYKSRETQPVLRLASFLLIRLFFSFLFLLFTESMAVTETGVISQGSYFSDICQVVGTNYVWYFKEVAYWTFNITFSYTLLTPTATCIQNTHVFFPMSFSRD